MSLHTNSKVFNKIIMTHNYTASIMISKFGCRSTARGNHGATMKPWPPDEPSDQRLQCFNTWKLTSLIHVCLEYGWRDAWIPYRMQAIDLSYRVSRDGTDTPIIPNEMALSSLKLANTFYKTAYLTIRILQGSFIVSLQDHSLCPL